MILTTALDPLADELFNTIFFSAFAVPHVEYCASSFVCVCVCIKNQQMYNNKSIALMISEKYQPKQRAGSFFYVFHCQGQRVNSHTNVWPFSLSCASVYVYQLFDNVRPYNNIFDENAHLDFENILLCPAN